MTTPAAGLPREAIAELWDRLVEASIAYEFERFDTEFETYRNNIVPREPIPAGQRLPVLVDSTRRGAVAGAGPEDNQCPLGGPRQRLEILRPRRIARARHRIHAAPR